MTRIEIFMSGGKKRKKDYHANDKRNKTYIILNAFNHKLRESLVFNVT